LDIGIHQYIFVASILDPCVSEDLREMMTTEEYNQPKSDVIAVMVEKLKGYEKCQSKNAHKTQLISSAATHPAKNDSKCSHVKYKMFHR
jgi:hypothetical protein